MLQLRFAGGFGDGGGGVVPAEAVEDVWDRRVSMTPQLLDERQLGGVIAVAAEHVDHVVGAAGDQHQPQNVGEDERVGIQQDVGGFAAGVDEP